MKFVAELNVPRFWVVLGCVLGVASGLCRAAATSPELTGITPFSVRPGETIEVRWSGTNLQKPLGLWSSFGAKVEWTSAEKSKDGKPAKDDGKELFAKMSLPADARLGIGFMRIATASGLSGPLFFYVDELPVTKRGKSIDSIEKAQPLTLPCAVEGTTDATRANFYRFDLKPGESVSVDIFAARIASALDPVVRLIDEKGNELIAVDDTPALGGDCRLRHRSDKGGPHILEIRDSAYNGGGLYRYHIRIGDFPLVTNVFPPSAAPGATLAVSALGEAVQGVGTINVSAPKFPGESTPVAVRFAPDKPAAYSSVRASESVVFGSGKSIAAPCTILGRIEKKGARETFEFPAKKGESFALTPITRQLGSPAIVYIAVLDKAGAQISNNEKAEKDATTECVSIFKAPADGVYQVVVEDAAGNGGPDFVYGIHVERNDRGFALKVSDDRFVVGRGGVFSAKVTAQRRNAKDAITLELASADDTPLHPGFSIENNVIEKGKNDTQIKIKAPADVALGSQFHLRIKGRTKEGGEEYIAAASLPEHDPKKKKDDHVAKMLLSMPQVPHLLRDAIVVCVGPDAPDFFALELAEKKDVSVALDAGKTSFVIRQMALDSSFDQPVDLKFEGAPKGVAVQHSGGRGGRIKDQTDFVCEVTCAPDMKPGSYTFNAIGLASHKGVTKEVRLEKISLRIVAQASVGVKK